MVDYGQQAPRVGTASPVPSGLNPRLESVRQLLTECEKTLYEMRARLGVAGAPADKRKEEVSAGGISGMTMDLMAIAGRLLELLRETAAEVA